MRRHTFTATLVAVALASAGASATELRMINGFPDGFVFTREIAEPFKATARRDRRIARDRAQGGARRVMNALARLHDASSRALFGIAGAALAAIVALYVFEVGARYLFGAPTSWSAEVVQYCLALVVFLGLPEATRRGAHIAIDMVPAALPPRAGDLLARATALAAAAACLYAGLIAIDQAQIQAARGVMTNAAHPIPRFWITGVIALGLLGAALHLVRQGLARRGPAPAEDAR